MVEPLYDTVDEEIESQIEIFTRKRRASLYVPIVRAQRGQIEHLWEGFSLSVTGV